MEPTPASTAVKLRTKRRWTVRLDRLGRWFFAFLGTAAVAVLLAAVAGVFKPKVPESPAAAPQRQVPAGVARVAVRQLLRPRYETAVGTIRPVHESTLSAKLLARVAEVNVVAGQAVAAGEVLVRLDDQDLQARLRQATASLDAAEATWTRANADFRRADELLRKNAISRAEFERADANLKTATADRARAEQALAEAKIVAEYATIAAPFAGTVIEKLVDVGDTVVPGQPLLTLYDPTKMQMVASVRESLAIELQVGQTLPARLDALGYACEAMISEIVPRAEVGSRTMDVKVTGPCPAGVYSGMFGRLMIPQGEESITVIPQTAVNRIGQLTLVAVVDETGNWQRRYVTIGRQFDAVAEVLSGLRPGEIVLDPVAALQVDRDE